LISLPEQIAAVKRELQRRRQFWPEQIRRGKMTRANAEQGIAQMEAVLATLQACLRREARGLMEVER
jgi:hypothetical protein